QGTRYRTGSRRRRDDILPAMQRYACSTDFFDERFAARLKFFQIRRTKWLVSGIRKDQVSYLEIAYRAIVRRRKRVDLFCNTQRCLSDFVIRPNVTNQGRINRVSENDESVVTKFNRIAAMRKCTRYHEKGVGCADKEAKLF